MTNVKGKSAGGKKTPVLKHGRPPLAKMPSAKLSSKATRTLIRSHHSLHKSLVQARAAHDDAAVRAIEKQISARGGLESYQLASTLGQAAERGGDSSRVLVEWLQQGMLSSFDVARTPQDGDDAAAAAADSGQVRRQQHQQQHQQHQQRLRLLEIGALSTQNACSTKLAARLDVSRIDLHAREPGIREIDFMELPEPQAEAERFDVVSLSLVLNYVPRAAARGDMLRRTRLFLRSTPPRQPTTTTTTTKMTTKTAAATTTNTTATVPDAATGAANAASSLFLVLPLPCVSNSRYLTEGRLSEIMESLGFELDKCKKTAKLYYSLWSFRAAASPSTQSQSFPKEELRPGGKRNNFAIVL